MTEIEKAMAAKVRAAKMLKEAQDEMDICEAMYESLIDSTKSANCNTLMFKYLTNKANIS
jgi:hypothetical protein